jgi:hypothetical protein
MQTIDFLHPSKPSTIGWLFLGLGIVALSASLSGVHSVKQQRERAVEEAKARAANAARDRLLVSEHPQPTPEDRRLQRVVPLLTQPWLATLRLIEGVTEPPIYLTGLAIDPATGYVRIEGQAPSFHAALTYSQILLEPEVLEHARLQSHEYAKDEPNAPTKFTVIARWRGH